MYIEEMELSGSKIAIVVFKMDHDRSSLDLLWIPSCV